MAETTLGMPDEMPEAPAAELAEDAGEILSQSLLAGREVKPGDTITLVVKSVNDDDGTFVASASESEPEEMGGIGSMAAAFDQ